MGVNLLLFSTNSQSFGRHWILVAKKHPTYPQLPLNVDEADLPGFPSLLTFLVNVSHTWRWGQDQRLHVGFLPMDLLFWAVGGKSYLGKFPDGWGLDPWRRSVRHLITNSNGYIQEKTFIRVIFLSRLLELLAIFPKVIPWSSPAHGEISMLVTWVDFLVQTEGNFVDEPGFWKAQKQDSPASRAGIPLCLYGRKLYGPLRFLDSCLIICATHTTDSSIEAALLVDVPVLRGDSCESSK